MIFSPVLYQLSYLPEPAVSDATSVKRIARGGLLDDGDDPQVAVLHEVQRHDHDLARRELAREVGEHHAGRALAQLDDGLAGHLQAIDGRAARADELGALGDRRRGRHQRVAVLARALELDTEDGAVGLTNEAALLRLEADTARSEEHTSELQSLTNL